MGRWTKERLIAFEDKVIREFKKGKINCPIHLSGGNEDELIKTFKGIEKEDWVISTHRNHYHYLLKGGNSNKLMAELKGCIKGCCGGSGRSMHIFDAGINFLTSGIVAGGCAIAVGIAYGLKQSGTKGCVWCFIGDGGEDSGHFYEAQRYAHTLDLPIVFVIEDNNLSIDTDKVARWNMDWGIAYGSKVIRYRYKRKYPHVGIGEHISF